MTLMIESLIIVSQFSWRGSNTDKRGTFKRPFQLPPSLFFPLTSAGVCAQTNFGVTDKAVQMWSLFFFPVDF